MRSTSGRDICSTNCRAYTFIESRNRRWPSAKIRSNASVLLPEPLTPVTTTNLSRGITSERFFKIVLARAMNRNGVFRSRNMMAIVEHVVIKTASPLPRDPLLRVFHVTKRQYDYAHGRISSGVPAATSLPPSSPASGPRSMTQSADLMTSRLCSMTRTECPPSTRRWNTLRRLGHRESGARSWAHRIRTAWLGRNPRAAWRCPLGCSPSMCFLCFRQVTHQFKPLALATRQRVDRLPQLQIPEADLDQPLQGAAPGAPVSNRSKAPRKLTASSTVASSKSPIENNLFPFDESAAAIFTSRI